MGNAASVGSAAASSLDDDGGGGLFGELGVPALRRPSPRELRELWDEFDVDRNDALGRDDARAFLRAASERWGGGEWPGGAAREAESPSPSKSGGGGAAAGGGELGRAASLKRARRAKPCGGGRKGEGGKCRSSAPPPPPSEALLARVAEGGSEITWERLLSALWDGPALGVSSGTALLFQSRFRRRMDKVSERVSDPNDAADLAAELLRSARAPGEAVRRAVRSARKLAAAGGGVTFEEFLRVVGPAHASALEEYEKEAYAGLNDDSEGDLGLGGKIRSFAPPRKRTRVEILNCGQAAMTSVLRMVKAATTEIMMSWWEFLPGLPAIRSAELGNDAWSHGDGVLTSILRAKAEAGVKVYILLWDIPDVIMPTAPLVEHAVRSLGRSHPNIHVVEHPGLAVWTRTHHQKFVVVDRCAAVLGGIDWTLGRWDSPSHAPFDPEGAMRPGADLARGSDADLARGGVRDWWERPERDPVEDRGEQMVESWQDVAIRVHGDAACDVALNFIHRWEHVRRDTLEIFGDGLRDNVPEIPIRIKFLGVPRSDAGVVDDAAQTGLDAAGFASPGTARECKCQIVRSLGAWSGGLPAPETSHYEAWIAAINSAEKFVYIEQQYFVANMGEGAARNRVAEAILARVHAAVREGRPFRVYVVVPASVSSEAVSYFTRRTLLQDGRDREGKMCLMGRVRLVLAQAEPGSYWHGVEAERVLSVCTLYTAGRSASGRWDVGSVFVHSKVLVCDDRAAVIGSANVNDRSFVGGGDSEIGAIVWDGDGGSNGPGPVADFRRRLWRQYLGEGAKEDAIADPSSEAAYSLWDGISRDNLELLSSVTDWTPRDSIGSFGQWKKLLDRYNSKTPAEKAAALREPDRLADFKGQLVMYPPNFLGDQRKRSAVEAITTSLPLARQYFL